MHGLKKIVALIVVISVSLLVSCAQKTDNISSTDSSNTDSLSVYYDDQGEDALFELIKSSYNELYPDVEITMYDPTGGDATMSPENALIKLKADMMAGSGPDVIISTGNDYSYKMMESGMFQDINPLIEKDSSFHLEDFDSAILNSGVNGDSRFFVPVLFTSSSIMTTETKLSEANIEKDALSSPEGLMNTFKGSVSRGLTKSNIVAMALMSWLEGIIDYENNTIIYENPYLRDVIDLLKNTKDSESDTVSSSFVEYAYEKEMFFTNVNTFFQVEYYELCDGECVLSATPSNEGGTTAYVMMFFAINRNCGNPDLAWEFSKCMLEETFQSNFEAHGSIPVIKNMQPESYAYLCRKYSAGNDTFVETMTSDFQKSIGNITSAVTAFECNDVYLLLDKFTPYINDEKSYEDCLTEAVNFFSIYLAE